MCMCVYYTCVRMCLKRFSNVREHFVSKSIAFVRTASLTNMRKFKPYTKYGMFLMKSNSLIHIKREFLTWKHLCVCVRQNAYMSFDLAFNHCQLSHTPTMCRQPHHRELVKITFKTHPTIGATPADENASHKHFARTNNKI